MSAASHARPARSAALARPALVGRKESPELEFKFLTSLFAELSGLPQAAHLGRRAEADTAIAGAGEGAGPPERE